MTLKKDNQILSRARAEIRKYMPDLKALRKTRSRSKKSVKLKVAYPHTIGKLVRNKNKTSISRIGVQILLLENEKAVGTMLFMRKGGRLKFSHFSFNKETSKVLLSHIRFAMRKLKLQTSESLQIVTTTLLATPAIRFKTTSGVLYLEVDAAKRDKLISEEEFLEIQDAHLAELKRGDAEFREEKEEIDRDRQDRLRKLNYL